MGHEMLNFHRLVPMIYPLHKKHGEFMEIYLVVEVASDSEVIASTEG